MGIQSIKELSGVKEELAAVTANNNSTTSGNEKQTNSASTPTRNRSNSRSNSSKKPNSKKEFVAEKLQRIYKGMNPADLNSFAEILSDKDKLLKTYLHTDFRQARALQKKIDVMAQKEQKKNKRKHSVSSSQANASSNGTTTTNESNLLQTTENTSTLSESNGVDTDDTEDIEEEEEEQNEEEDDRVLSMLYDQKASQQKLRIKLIVAETSRNMLEKNLKKIVSPFLTTAMGDSFADFGLFHIALGVGPWKIEWNSSCLCIPRTITGQAAVICADIESIDSLEDLETVRNKLAEVIVKWNTEITYKQHGGNPEVDKTGNCQEFIEDVMKHLGVKLPKFPAPLQNYIKKLRATGSADMEFEMDDEFRQKFKHITSKKITFKTHKELDQFVIDLQNVDPDFQYSYKFEYYMLKSFDRAMWMKLLRNKASAQNEKLLPLLDEEGCLCCAFGDPQKQSILDVKVKKL